MPETLSPQDALEISCDPFYKEVGFTRQDFDRLFNCQFDAIPKERLLSLIDHCSMQGMHGHAQHAAFLRLLWSPSDVEFRWERAWFLKTHHPDLAIEECESILEDDPGHWGAQRLIADLRADII